MKQAFAYVHAENRRETRLGGGRQWLKNQSFTHTNMKRTATYEAPTVRIVVLQVEGAWMLSMTNGFIYDAEEQDEYWVF